MSDRTAALCGLCDRWGTLEDPNTGEWFDCDHKPVDLPPRPTSDIPEDPFLRLAAAASRILELEGEVGRLRAAITEHRDEHLRLDKEPNFDSFARELARGDADIVLWSALDGERSGG